MGTTTFEEKLIQHLMDTREAILFEVFLNFQKEYDSLNQYRCLEVFVAYGVGPRVLQILLMYRVCLTMVDKAIGYYSPPSRNTALLPKETPIPHDLQCGHGNSHPPLGDGGGGNKCGRGGTWQVDTEPGGLIYAKTGHVMLTQPEMLKRSFDILTDLFNWVGLWKNKCKTMNMAFQLCHTPCMMLVVVYERWAKGNGPEYWDWHRMQVQYPKFRVEVSAGLLLAYCKDQHGVVRGGQGGVPPPLLPS